MADFFYLSEFFSPLFRNRTTRIRVCKKSYRKIILQQNFALAIFLFDKSAGEIAAQKHAAGTIKFIKKGKRKRGQ
jgi:hypothetical protein